MGGLKWVLVWCLLVGCTFRVEEGTRRIWVGEQVTDWIELGTIQRFVNGEAIILYQDLSPITQASVVDRGGCSFIVRQAEAIWLVESMTGPAAEEYLVTNITELQAQMLYDYSSQVYP